MDCSPPGSSVHGISQIRILEWGAIPFSRDSSWPKNWTQVFCIAGRFFTIWATSICPGGPNLRILWEEKMLHKSWVKLRYQAWHSDWLVRINCSANCIWNRIQGVCVWSCHHSWVLSKLCCCSVTQLCPTLWPHDTCKASLSFIISWSLLKLMSIELMMPSNHLILCRSILLLPSIGEGWVFAVSCFTEQPKGRE